MAEQDFGEFSMEVTRKPVPGVTIGQVPPALVKLLEQHVPAVVKSADHELTLTAKDKATAQKLALYARAWGAQQTPKLYIHKIPNRRDMSDNVARLSVELDKDVTTRPGRPKAE